MSFVSRTPSHCLIKPSGTAWTAQRAPLNSLSASRTRKLPMVDYQRCRYSSTSHQAAGAAKGPAKPATATETAQVQATQRITQVKPPVPVETRKKTVAELDEELRLKLEGISGEGGASGVEYEDGQAHGLKRHVKANMFRVI